MPAWSHLMCKVSLSYKGYKEKTFSLVRLLTCTLKTIHNYY